MLTCCIRYEIDPFKRAQFQRYARLWGEAIPRCGADLIGYFAPHEGAATVACTNCTTSKVWPRMKRIGSVWRRGPDVSEDLFDMKLQIWTAGALAGMAQLRPAEAGACSIQRMPARAPAVQTRFCSAPAFACR